MSPWLALVADALATARLTRLVTRDTISEPARAAAVRWAFRRADVDLPALEVGETISEAIAAHEMAGGVVPRLATLVTCGACAGVWCAALVVAAGRVAPRAWEPVGRGLALSATAGLLARLEDAWPATDRLGSCGES